MTTQIGHLFEPLSGRAWSSEEIGWRLRDRCAILGKLRLIEGDRVFLHYGNALEFFIDILAIWQLGACAVPLDSRLTPFEGGTLAEFARPRFSIWSEMPDDSLVRRLANISVASLAKAVEPSSDDMAAGLPHPRLRRDN